MRGRSGGKWGTVGVSSAIIRDEPYEDSGSKVRYSTFRYEE